MLEENDRMYLQNQITEVKKVLQTNRRKGICKYALFLDFDGVIHVFYQEGTPKYKEALKRMQNHFDFVDPEAIANVDRLTGIFELDIIVSSSWRYNGLSYCRKYLEKSGMKNYNAVKDTTQTEFYMDRRLEITDYLLKHPAYSGFVVLDDIPMTEFKGSYISIDPTEGFNKGKYEQAVQILKGYMRK